MSASLYERWKEAIAAAGSGEEVSAILAACRDGLAAGDKIGWPLAARAALFEPDVDIAAATLERETAAFPPGTHEAAMLREVATVFRVAARRIAQMRSS